MKVEVSIMKVRDNGEKYKVTKKIPELSVSETKLFKTKKEAMKQLREWLN